MKKWLAQNYQHGRDFARMCPGAPGKCINSWENCSQWKQQAGRWAWEAGFRDEEEERIKFEERVRKISSS